MAVEIDFEKMGGLAPAIVQDAGTGEVLMLGFMNREPTTRPSNRLCNVSSVASATSFGPRVKLPGIG